MKRRYLEKQYSSVLYSAEYEIPGVDPAGITDIELPIGYWSRAGRLEIRARTCVGQEAIF